MDYRDKLKSFRKYMQWTQKEMAEHLGYNSQQVISDIENGNKNMSNVAKKCLDYLAEKYKW